MSWCAATPRRCGPRSSTSRDSRRAPRATAEGLRGTEVASWTGAAADAFRARLADEPVRWSRAADAFRSAAQAWERFGAALVAAQAQAERAAAMYRAGAAAAERAYADFSLQVDRYLARLVMGRQPGPAPVLADTGAAEIQAARALLADARARRDAAGNDAARAVAAAAALAPDPPTGWDLRAAAVADWVGANGIELAHAAQGLGEGAEGLVRFARTFNPTDPYALYHPARFVENASAGLAGAVDTLTHPLHLVAGVVGPGWGSDPARAFGRLVPTVLAGVVGGRSALGAAGDVGLPSALGRAGAASTRGGAVGRRGGAETWRRRGSGRRSARRRDVAPPAPPPPLPQVAVRPPALMADPRPTARPFTPVHGPGGADVVAGLGPDHGGPIASAPVAGPPARQSPHPAPAAPAVPRRRGATRRPRRTGPWRSDWPGSAAACRRRGNGWRPRTSLRTRSRPARRRVGGRPDRSCGRPRRRGATAITIPSGPDSPGSPGPTRTSPAG